MRCESERAIGSVASVVYRHSGVIGMLCNKRKQPEATAICRVPYIHVCCLCFCWRFCCITAERTMGDSLARRPYIERTSINNPSNIDRTSIEPRTSIEHYRSSFLSQLLARCVCIRWGSPRKLNTKPLRFLFPFWNMFLFENMFLFGNNMFLFGNEMFLLWDHIILFLEITCVWK